MQHRAKINTNHQITKTSHLISLKINRTIPNGEYAIKRQRVKNHGKGNVFGKKALPLYS